MLRRLIPVVLLLLAMTAVGATPLSKAATDPASGATNLARLIIHGPTFGYSLAEDHDPDLCEHMLRVFNDKFAHLWDAPPLTSLTNDPNYSANGKYAFPLLPGVKHSPRVTEEMSYSAWPTSPEFSAIKWKEGSAVFGGCPAGKTCPGNEPMPILLAYFDFDNDGSVDTVIKYGTFFPGFNGIFTSQEYLDVWRGQRLAITDTPSLWNLSHPPDKKLTPIMMTGLYLRPFIYRGVTYVASYGADAGNQTGPFYLWGGPPYPVQEDMLIERTHFTGRRAGTIGALLWSTDTVCDLRMKRLKN